MIHACWNVFPGHGYTVEIRDGNGIVESYSAGDCRWDSQVYGTGMTSEATLERHAVQTAREMLEEHGGRGEPERDEDIE